MRGYHSAAAPHSLALAALSELQEIVREKIRRNLTRMKSDVQGRIGKAKVDHAARGVLNSSMYVKAVAGEWMRAYDDATPIICTELQWWLRQCFYVTERKAVEIADAGVNELAACFGVSAVASLEATKDRISNPATIESLTKRLHGARENAEGEIKLFVRRWREENQRNVLKFLGGIIRKMAGAG